MADENISARFHDDTLLDFLSSFDPLTEKYRYPILDQAGPGGLAPQVVQSILNYEALHRAAPRTQDQYDALYQDLRLIYGDHEPIRKYLYIYNLVHTKLLSQYLQIPGLEKLFTSQYFRYEWDMHLGINYQQHVLTDYRDHFIHQVKNVHAMFVLLEDFGFLSRITNIVNTGESVIASYIMKAAKLYKESVGNSTAKVGSMSLPEIFEALCNASRKSQLDLFIERIVLYSAVMAGLFHDIGYPISHSSKRQKQIEEYLPTISYFLSGRTDYARISSLLVNTLLYTIVSKDEIRKHFDRGDHGTLSALAFLLYFYETGTIYGLDPIQKASIELAALTMYNHTLHYEITGSKGEYFRPVFYRNPISFLFRLCDDLQEWQRLYFHLVDNRNWRICQHCLTPIIHRRIWDATRSTEGDVRICGCHSQISQQDFTRFHQARLAPPRTQSRLITLRSAVHTGRRNGDITISNIRYRRLNHIKLCDWGEFRKFGSHRIVYEVHYNCYGLLQMAAIDPSFAPYRANEFQKLRKLLSNQDMPEQLVVSFVSTNPITLKVKILGDFLNAYAAQATRSNLGKAALKDSEDNGPCTYTQDILLLNRADRDAVRDFCQKYRSPLYPFDKNRMNTDASELAKRFAACFPQVAQTMLQGHLEFYLSLLQVAWGIQHNVTQSTRKESLMEYAQRAYLLNSLVKRYQDLNRSQALDTLLLDFLTHAADSADFEALQAEGASLPENYNDQYCYDHNQLDQFCAAVKSYTDRDTYRPFRGSDSLDFYSDLYAFYVFSETTAILERFSKK